MRRPSPDKYEALVLLESMPASEVIEVLGLKQHISTVTRWAQAEYGVIPTRRQLARKNPEREALMRSMEADGLDRRYCAEQHYSFWPCLIRHSQDGHVFVCRKHARRGDL